MTAIVTGASSAVVAGLPATVGGRLGPSDGPHAATQSATVGHSQRARIAASYSP